MEHIRTWYGIFSVKNDNIISCELYPKDVKTLVDRLEEIPSALETSEVVDQDIRSLARVWKFVSSEEEYDDIFHDVNMEHAARQVTASLSDEQVLIRSIDAMDDLDRIINALSERLKELYDLNFPELGMQGESLVRFVARYGARKELWQVDDEKVRYRAGNSTGIILPPSLADNLKEMAHNISGLYNNREQLSRYIEKYMRTTFPNLSAVAGIHIGARLFSMAGNARKLASMPSSTVQVLGAHKALFKHLKGSAPSPKHGLIFQHPLVKESPWWLRGKVARVLAAKISTAVRVDYYSGDLRPGIAKDMDMKVDELKKRHPRPPKRRNGY